MANMEDIDLTLSRILSRSGGNDFFIGIRNQTPNNITRDFFNAIDKIKTFREIFFPWENEFEDYENTNFEFQVEDAYAHMYDGHCDRCGAMLQFWDWGDYSSLCAICYNAFDAQMSGGVIDSAFSNKPIRNFQL
jgi:hypothetical protein